jgi:hypothetical protein
MHKHILPMVGLLAATALALPAFPTVKAETGSFSKTITVAERLDIGGTSLQPGRYKVIVNGNDVTVEHDGKTVAQTTGTLQLSPQKYETTEIVFGPDLNVQEIRFGGHHQDLMLNASRAPMPAGEQQ